MKRLSMRNFLFLIVTIGALFLFAACGSDSGDDATDNSGDDSTTSNIAEEVDYKIVGIDPGAGVVKSAEEAVEEYDLKGWEVQTSSGGAMTTELGQALNKEEPIIVTGWSPHWKFEEYDLKYLEDPKGVFGDEETIETMVREGLKDDEPEAYKLLEQFEWEVEDLEAVMLRINEGEEPKEAAQNWVEENEELVETWKEGVDEVDGNQIELVYVEWDTEVASTHVVGHVLEELGFEVKLTSLDNAVMWKAVAEGEADGMVAAWLPGTHGDLYEEYKDELEELGPNLSGAKIGLVVPEYVDIDSIEDLQAK